MITPQVFTVSQINSRVSSLIASDPALQTVFVEGELSNVNINSKSGHMYFSLKDSKSVIRAVMFAWSVRNLRFRPEDGMKVIMRAQVTVYEPAGQYQLRVEDMQPDGVGVLAMQLEQLKKKLGSEGLFAAEHKKPIPAMPKTVGVITSPTGAALRDIMQIIGRRFPIAQIVLAPVLVQGEEAPAQLARAVRLFSDQRVADVLIIGRGGGSMEDLWAFNDEDLARAIYDCEIPVISAVGHETDFTICDFVSDLRAPTPSAAAELAVPDSADLNAVIDSALYKVRSSLYNRMTLLRQQYDRSSKLIEAYSPFEEVNKQRKFIDALSDRAKYLAESRLSTAQAAAGELIAKAQALDPLAVLNRGFSYVVKDDHPAVSVYDIKSGDMVDIVFKDGRVKAEIK